MGKAATPTAPLRTPRKARKAGAALQAAAEEPPCQWQGTPSEQASYYLLRPLEEEKDGEDGETDDLQPVVVAESQTSLKEMTVGSAVMQLDLAEAPVIVFKNAAHGRLNIVYRRRDGHIGWIDPAS